MLSLVFVGQHAWFDDSRVFSHPTRRFNSEAFLWPEVPDLFRSQHHSRTQQQQHQHSSTIFPISGKMALWLQLLHSFESSSNNTCRSPSHSRTAQSRARWHA